MPAFLCFLLASVLFLATTAGNTATPSLSLEEIGRYETGVFDQSAAEIAAFDAGSQRLFVVNAAQASLDILDIRNPTDIKLDGRIAAKAYGSTANSVSTHKGLIALAVTAHNPQAPGSVIIFDARSLKERQRFTVGAMPDMLTFSPDGQYLLTANEGEPNDAYTTDPEGSVSIIDLRAGLDDAKVTTADFRKFIGQEAALRASGVRIFGPRANAAQDLEPEYLTVSTDSRTAWVTLQENNALAVVDLGAGEIRELLPLGYKDHRQKAYTLDPSDKDGLVNIKPWPVLGMYQPDSIVNYSVDGSSYLVMANEGDARDYDGYSEESRIGDLTLAPEVFMRPKALQAKKYLGRLKTTTAMGDVDNDGEYEQLYSFGGRSFSIRDTRGQLIYDSGNDFEKITSKRLGENFNNDNAEHDPDGRSDAKGPEPEALTVARIQENHYAFIGLERVGGIMVYDISNPYAPSFVDYVNDRDFSKNPATAEEWQSAGDLGPEGLLFLPAEISPNKHPLLVVTNEVSGTTTIYQINQN